MRVRKPVYKKLWFWAACLVILGLLANAISIHYKGGKSHFNGVNAKQERNLKTWSERTARETFRFPGKAVINDNAYEIYVDMEGKSDAGKHVYTVKSTADTKTDSGIVLSNPFTVVIEWDGEAGEYNVLSVNTQENMQLTDMQKIQLKMRAEDVVSANLKAPATAEFAPPGDCSYNCEYGEPNCKFSVRAYVDSQNSFGALLRSNFTVSMEWDGSQKAPTVTDIQIQ